jgi:hypothetical protein
VVAELSSAGGCAALAPRRCVRRKLGSRLLVSGFDVKQQKPLLAPRWCRGAVADELSAAAPLPLTETVLLLWFVQSPPLP